MGKALRDILSQTTDSDHHFRLVVDTTQMVRDKERFPLVQDGRVGLGEYYRLVRALQCSMQLLIMCGIVHANGKYLHTAAKVQKKSALRKQCRFFLIS